LTATSLADRTTVVGRGKWILDNILGAPPPPPPPDVPPLKENENNGKVLSLRARMEHRASPTCAVVTRGWIAGLRPRELRCRSMARRESDSQLTPRRRCPTARSSARSGFAHVASRPAGTVCRRAHREAGHLRAGSRPRVRTRRRIRKIVREAGGAGSYRFQSLIVGVTKSASFQMRRSRDLENPAPTSSVRR
jgi:hypothetical protein